MKDKVLITGATGNVGIEVIRAYPDRTSLRAAVLDLARDQEALGADIDCVRFDFENPATWTSAFAGVRAMFLMRPPHITNIKDTIAPMIAAAHAAGVEHIVFLSLVGVENNRWVPHYKIEQAILASGIDYTFLRASFFMQNLNTTHRAEISDRNEISVPVGHAKTSFIDVRDIAGVAVKALSQDGHRRQSYTLTGSEALDYYAVADIMTDVLERPIRYANPSILGFLARQIRGGRPVMFTLVMTMLYTLTRFGTAKDVSPQVGQLLGRAPISLRQYVEDYRAAWG